MPLPPREVNMLPFQTFRTGNLATFPPQPREEKRDAEQEKGK